MDQVSISSAEETSLPPVPGSADDPATTKVVANRGFRPDGFMIAGVALLGLYLVASWSWAKMDPAHLLWICDIALLLCAIGLLRRSALLLTAQLTAVCMIHLMWNLDFWTCFLFDYLPTGSTAYMFQYHHTVLEKGISFAIHVFMIPIVFSAIVVLGVPRNAWRLQALQTLILAILTGLLTSPSQKINWIFGSLIADVTPAMYVVYLIGWVVGFPLLFYWPTNLLLRWLATRCRNWLGVSHVPVDAPIDKDVDIDQALPWFRAVARHSAVATLAVVGVMAAVGTIMSQAADERFALDPRTFKIDTHFQSGLSALPAAPLQTHCDEMLDAGDRSQRIRLLAWPEPQLPTTELADDAAGGARGPRIDRQAVLQRVPASEIPEVPGYVVLRGRRQVPGSVVWLYVAGDSCRFARYCDIYTYHDTFDVWCKMEDLIGPASDPRVGPSGAATEPLRHNSAAAGIYALGVIELLDGQPVSRSPAYLVRFPHTQPSTESSE